MINTQPSVTLVIYSRNRAMQLDGLLRSIERHASKVFDPIVILYRADPPFDSGYDLLPNLHKSHFIKRTNIKQDTLSALAGDYSCFMPDDALLFRDVSNEVTSYLTDDILCFSLRLGRNTTYCYPLDKKQALPLVSDYSPDKKVIKWRWRGAEGDFGYPFALDGHIFRTAGLVKVVESLEFEIPTDLEGQWQTTTLMGADAPNMASFELSRLVSVPANRIQNVNHNRNEGGSPLALHDLFMKGYRLDLDGLNYSTVAAAHWPLDLKFYRPTANSSPGWYGGGGTS